MLFFLLIAHLRYIKDKRTKRTEVRKQVHFRRYIVIGGQSLSVDKAEKKASTTLGDYEQTKVASWPAVTKIKSVFDAVIGVTSDGKMFVDGFCPCSEADLMRIMGLNE